MSEIKPVPIEPAAGPGKTYTIKGVSFTLLLPAPGGDWWLAACTDSETPAPISLVCLADRTEDDRKKDGDE